MSLDQESPAEVATIPPSTPPQPPASFHDDSSASTSIYSTPSPLHHRFSLKDPVLLKNFIIGFSDGVTVPFALTAGLGALGDKHVVLEGGLAELFAGAISMALGTWLAARTERTRYNIAEAKEREKLTVGQIPPLRCGKQDVEAGEGVEASPGRNDGSRMVENQLMRIFGGFGFRRRDVRPMSAHLSKDDNLWVEVSIGKWNRYHPGLTKK